MLIDFKVSNYRPIYQAQTLSMIADKDKSHLANNCIATGIKSMPQLVRSAVLYGPNASGKSSLITALGFMREMVEKSTEIREGGLIPVSKFRFNKQAEIESSEFEITFLENGVRYQYGFTCDTTRITKEWLFVYVINKAQNWFQREYNLRSNKDDWYFGTHFPGGKQRHDWKKKTRENVLFLSTAINWNSEALRPVYNWFVNQLIVVSSQLPLSPNLTMNHICNGLDKATVIEFLQAADLGITDIEIKKEKGKTRQVHLESGKMTIGAEVEMDALNALFHHKNTVFSFLEESHGTQKLFSYAGPILDILRGGKTLIVDELDAGLHPKMMQFLISLFQNSKINKKNAQLIFTTHNTFFLDPELFRRDQIWFIEKDETNASHLYPLSDFSPRKSEALEKGYLIGRYGALPFFGEFKL